MRKLLLLPIALFLATSAHAACSGSGTTWSCTAGSTPANVQTAINSATNGAVITFAAGSYTWSTSITMPTAYGVTLICATAPPADPSPGTPGGNGAATVGGCNVSTSANPTFDYNGSATVSFLLRVSGFNITQTGGQFIFWLADGCISAPCIYQQIRIDHNTVAMLSGNNMVQRGENAHNQRIYGVVDHNLVTGSGNVALAVGSGVGEPTPPASALGTVNNLFFENNTITITTVTNTGLGCLDGWGSTTAYVARYNVSTNCLWTSHGMDHAGGVMNYEVYKNNIQMNSGANGTGLQNCFRCFHHQGSGTILVFSNNLTPAPAAGHSGTPISVAHYRAYENGPSIDGNLAPCNGAQSPFSFSGMTVTDGNRAPSGSNYGYPCWRQPGRDFQGNYSPMYSWNNVWTDDGTMASITLDDVNGGTVPNGSFPPNNCTLGAAGNCDYITFHLKLNRDAYQAVSVSAQSNATTPFNGTTGMGFGTAANRPTTCTTNATESGAGVGYFATNTGAQGTLYTCSATNTWSVYYTPYTYPHPLVGGGTATVATPTFSPAAGSYLSPQIITISTTTGGATICYTNDGTTPAANGAGTCTHGTTLTNGGTVTVNFTTLLQAVGSQSGFTDSAVGSAQYTFPTASTPTSMARLVRAMILSLL